MTWQTLPLMRVFLAAQGILVAGLVLTISARGQSEGKDDLLDRQRRLLEVQSQKIEADVRAALTEAQRLAANDSALALEKLRAALTEVQDDSALTPKRKEMLIRVLKDRIRVTNLADRTEEKSDKPDLIRRRQEDQKETEKDDLQRSLDNIRALRKDGKLEEANQAAKELASKRRQTGGSQSGGQGARKEISEQPGGASGGAHGRDRRIPRQLPLRSQGPRPTNRRRLPRRGPVRHASGRRRRVPQGFPRAH